MRIMFHEFAAAAVDGAGALGPMRQHKLVRPCIRALGSCLVLIAHGATSGISEKISRLAQLPACCCSYDMTHMIYIGVLVWWKGPYWRSCGAIRLPLRQASCVRAEAHPRYPEQLGRALSIQPGPW